MHVEVTKHVLLGRKSLSCPVAVCAAAVCAAEPALGLLWKALPLSRDGDVLKLVVFVGILTCVGYWANRGLLPRTRPIVPGEWAISD
jgi:hypothetical protein